VLKYKKTGDRTKKQSQFPERFSKKNRNIPIFTSKNVKM
jgi:hypothetical protein